MNQTSTRTPGRLSRGLSARTALSCCQPGTEGTHTPGALLRVTRPSYSPSPFSPTPPPFNCWMSLQSCVPKTINSRERSYTKKGVSPEGDVYPWKPPPFTAA